MPQRNRTARTQKARAEKRFNDGRQLANSFLFEFRDAIKDLPGATPARRLVVRKALEYLDGLATEAGGDPSLQQLRHCYRQRHRRFRQPVWMDVPKRFGQQRGDRTAGQQFSDSRTPSPHQNDLIVGKAAQLPHSLTPESGLRDTLKLMGVRRANSLAPTLRTMFASVLGAKPISNLPLQGNDLHGPLRTVFRQISNDVLGKYYCCAKRLAVS